MKTATIKLLNLLHEGHSLGWLIDQVNDFSDQLNFGEVCMLHAKDDADLQEVRRLAYHIHNIWHE